VEKFILWFWGKRGAQVSAHEATREKRTPIVSVASGPCMKSGAESHKLNREGGAIQSCKEKRGGPTNVKPMSQNEHTQTLGEEL